MTKQLIFKVARLDEEAVSYAAISAYLGDDCIWPAPDDGAVTVDIFIDDLLSYLANFWLPINLRQTYPLDLDSQPVRPSQLDAAMAQRWLRLPEEQVEQEQGVANSFEEAHNIACCFDGQFDLPPFWILRQREVFLLDVAGRDYRVPYQSTVSALEAFGDSLADILSEKTDKWQKLIAAWRGRAERNADRILEFSAGLSPSKIAALIGGRYIVPPISFASAANDDDAILVAARMAGQLPIDEIKLILGIAKSFVKKETRAFSELLSAVQTRLTGASTKSPPHEQGEIVACFVREYLDLSDDFLDIRELVRILGIEVQEKTLFRSLHGIAICGRDYGPGILINKTCFRLERAGRKTKEAMLRYTLSHELCHLIVDSAHSFAAVDVLRGRMPPSFESRAQSFAGELLLPTKVALRIWNDNGRPKHEDGLRAVLEEAMKICGVTRSVASWKIQHAAAREDVNLDAILDGLAKKR